MLSLLTEKLGSTDKVHAGREQFTYIYLIIIDGLVVKTKHTHTSSFFDSDIFSPKTEISHLHQRGEKRTQESLQVEALLGPSQLGFFFEPRLSSKRSPPELLIAQILLKLFHTMLKR